MSDLKKISIANDVYETLEPMCFSVQLPAELGSLSLSETQRAYLSPAPPEPFPYPRSEGLRQAVRDSLRFRGYKPTGRGKPAAEYLIGAFEKEIFSPTKGINAAVDLCNLVSFHSGLPISVVDAGLLEGELRIDWAPPKTTYPFNPSGQLIDASGLVSLFDTRGVSGTPVKDSQRTKTNESTESLVTILWTPKCEIQHGQHVLKWYCHEQEALGWSLEPLS